VGYYVPDFNVKSWIPPNVTERDLLAIYIGAPINIYRTAITMWMQDGCNDCASFVLEEHSNVTNQTLVDYRATLPRARFAIEPPGDTLERMSRDASLLAGTVPVFFDFPSGAVTFLAQWGRACAKCSANGKPRPACDLVFTTTASTVPGAHGSRAAPLWL